MRRALTWLAGAVGLAALLRHLSRRHAPAPVPPAGQDPADELRRKLAGQQVDEEPEGSEESEPPDETDPAALEERRAQVHAQAQAAIDSMRDVGNDEPDGGAGA